MDNDQKEVDQIAELKAMMAQNLQKTEETIVKVDWIKSYLKWQQVMSFVKIFIIVIPVILGLMYLPPLLKGYIDQFSSLYK